ncbi:hypothetical protein ACH4N1_34765, partial [Streptomyces sp. NPDC017202]
MRNHPKHRRKTRRRPVAVAVLAIGAVAVPSAAMACRGDAGAASVTATSSNSWTAARKASWDGHRGRDARTAKPTATPSPSASVSPTTPPATAA